MGREAGHCSPALGAGIEWVLEMLHLGHPSNGSARGGARAEGVGRGGAGGKEGADKGEKEKQSRRDAEARRLE